MLNAGTGCTDVENNFMSKVYILNAREVIIQTCKLDDINISMSLYSALSVIPMN